MRGDRLIELLKQGIAVMWSRRRFRVVLHTENRKLSVTQPGDSLVIEIDLGDYSAAALQLLACRCKAVILGRDRHRSRFKVLDRLIATAVTEFEFHGFRAQGVTDDLVTHTDAKDRIIGDQLRDGLMGIGHR